MAGAVLTKLGEVLKAEVPYHEGPKNNETKYGAWYGFNFVAWCAIFLSWGCAKVGALYLGKPWRFASTIAARDHAKKNGRWTITPTVGTIAMMAHTAKTGHVGYLIQLLRKDGLLYTVTVEGNTNAQGSREGDQVAVRTRLATSWDGYIVLDETYTELPQPEPEPPQSDTEEEVMQPIIGLQKKNGAGFILFAPNVGDVPAYKIPLADWDAEGGSGTGNNPGGVDDAIKNNLMIYVRADDQMIDDIPTLTK